MQVHKRNQHSGSHANLAVNRAHKRRRIFIGPNRAERREFDNVKGRYEDEQAAKVEANLQRQRREAEQPVLEVRQGIDGTLLGGA